jgi:D-amino peptidase
MKIYIQTDIEGVAGFCFFEDRKNPSYMNAEHRMRMYRLLTNEVNAAVQGAFDAGADEVVVNDSHGSGYNILFEDLDPRCQVIHGKNMSGPAWMPLLDDSFDAMLLIGMHAMGGTHDAITPHSRWELNDGETFLSEGTMAAAIAGDLNVPAILVTGDDKIVAEFQEKIPGINSVQVKKALSPYQACSLIPAKSCELIREAAKNAILNRKNIKPYKIQGPLRLNLLDSANHCPPLVHVGETVTADTISEAFDRYERAMDWTTLDTHEPDGFVFQP